MSPTRTSRRRSEASLEVKRPHPAVTRRSSIETRSATRRRSQGVLLSQVEYREAEAEAEAEETEQEKGCDVNEEEGWEESETSGPARSLLLLTLLCLIVSGAAALSSFINAPTANGAEKWRNPAGGGREGWAGYNGTAGGEQGGERGSREEQLASSLVGASLLHSGSPSAAILELLRAQAMGREDHLIEYNLGAAWALVRDGGSEGEEGEFSLQNAGVQAVLAFERAVRIQPAHLPAWVNLGVAHMRQGKLDDAVAAFRRAIFLSDGLLDAGGGGGGGVSGVALADVPAVRGVAVSNLNIVLSAQSSEGVGAQ